MLLLEVHHSLFTQIRIAVIGVSARVTAHQHFDSRENIIYSITAVSAAEGGRGTAVPTFVEKNSPPKVGGRGV